MAYGTTGNVLRNLTGHPPGRNLYRFDFNGSVDTMTLVEVAGYFNNKDDDLNLAKGDIIFAVEWSGAAFAAAGTISHMQAFMVTNVIANDAAASAGNVDIGQILIASGALSSLA